MSAPVEACVGPLIWFDATDHTTDHQAAILECAACGYIIVTGNWHDAAHALTPVLREGLAA